MTTARTAAEVRSRFAAEQDYIQRYVEFLQAKSSIFDEDVWEIGSILRKHRLARFDRPRPREDHQYSPEELAKLIDSLREIAPRLDEAIARQERRFELVEKPDENATIADHPLLGEWIDYMVSMLVGDEDGDEAEDEEVSPELLKNLRRHALHQQEENRRETGDDDAINPDLIDNAIRWAVFIKTRRRLNTLHFLKDRFAELKLVERVTSPEAEINILRQGFILLMTAFDAAIFDLVRVALRNQFFGLIGLFGKQEKISLERLGTFGDFDAFRDQIIEEQLKVRYLKDLLFLLKGLGVKCADEEGGDRFADLIELVLRRNVHVHNRGIADERYLERDQKGVPQFNLFSLAVGDSAPIDGPYWKKAVKLCRICVEHVAAWAEGGSTA